MFVIVRRHRKSKSWKSGEPRGFRVMGWSAPLELVVSGCRHGAARRQFSFLGRDGVY
jgi:hypothetical protein